MRKIANTTELQDELRRILAYAQTELPSRKRIAATLTNLSERLGYQRRVASKTYVCVAELDRRGSPTDRKADSAEKAAEAAAKASHTANYLKDKGSKGKDSHGDYEEFTVMQGSRAQGSIKVYEEYE